LKHKNNNFESDANKESVEKGLVLVGIFGLMDPLRPGIKEAVA
jgi:magnesium-transporting ATPase (P-type)